MAARDDIFSERTLDTPWRCMKCGLNIPTQAPALCYEHRMQEAEEKRQDQRQKEDAAKKLQAEVLTPDQIIAGLNKDLLSLKCQVAYLVSCHAATMEYDGSLSKTSDAQRQRFIAIAEKLGPFLSQTEDSHEHVSTLLPPLHRQNTPDNVERAVKEARDRLASAVGLLEKMMTATRVKRDKAKNKKRKAKAKIKTPSPRAS